MNGESGSAPVFANCPPGPIDLGNNPVPLTEAMVIARAGTVTSSCGEITITAIPVSTTGSCIKTQTWKVRATDVCGAESFCQLIFTWKSDTQVPVFRGCPLPPINLGPNPIHPTANQVIQDIGLIADESELHFITSPGTISGDCEKSQSWVVTAIDICGNFASCEITYLWIDDNVPPTFTVPVKVTIPFISTTGYESSPAITGKPTHVSDNSNKPVTITYSDKISGCGNEFIITRTWTATDVCGNQRSQDQQIVVTDNNSPYLIYAQNEASFGENNTINGSIRVTATNGKADFRKGVNLSSTHFINAKNISVQLPSVVTPNRFYLPGNDGPSLPFSLYTAEPLSGNYSATGTPLHVPSENYKNLTIKKNTTVFVDGSDYGKITVEENATVTFTSNTLNIEELDIRKGRDGTTKILFTDITAVRVKNNVTIGENTRVNVGGPKVVFYIGDAKKHQENFLVKGDNTQVTAIIMIPNGKLKVTGGNNNAIMTGLFIVDKLESDGKNVLWTPFICEAFPPVTRNMPPAAVGRPAGVTGPFNVIVGPNPSTHEFRIRVEGSSGEPVHVKVFDVSGKIIQVLSFSTPEVVIGSLWLGGIYFVEVRQGNNRQIVKLLKMD